ncbi:putative RNA-directed DNA polymerase from transposon BS [Trichonephila clavipes]|nr:putative RNA-directed DNA polymerase from transposon BS [Trichonephila clavipes]
MHNDPCLRALVDKRDRLFQNLKYTNSDSIRVEFNKTDAEIKRLYAAKKRASWHEICSKIDARTTNSKLWSIAKSLSRDRTQVEVCNTIFTEDGFLSKDDRATANILGSHYQKMSRLTFSKADKNTERQAKLAVHKCRSLDLGEPVFLADFSMHQLLLVLNALDPKKSSGPDNIHGVMITYLGPKGTQHLLDIFNQSWKSVRLAHEWKRATIIPIRKPGKVLSSPESYGPVALTSIPSFGSVPYSSTVGSSHVGLLGNEVADDLAKAATSNPVHPENHMVLTSTEIYSKAKELICRTWVVPPVHPGYFQRHPGSAISIKGSSSYQTAFSRFSTGHLRCMNFEGGKRSFPFSPKSISFLLSTFCNVWGFYDI